MKSKSINSHERQIQSWRHVKEPVLNHVDGCSAETPAHWNMYRKVSDFPLEIQLAINK